MALCGLVEQRAEEGLRLEDVRLVDAGQLAGLAAFLAPCCQPEGEFMKLARRVCADPHDVADSVGSCRIPFDWRAVMHRGRVEQPFGGFADNHEVKSGCPWIGKPLRGVWIGADRPYAGIELEPVAQSQMRRDFGAVLVPD